MSDHDEPTEPFAPVTAEVVTGGEPEVAAEPEPESGVEPDGDGEAPPKESLFAAVTGRRLAIALVVIALVWLGVWAYSSNSASTGSSSPTAPSSPAATTPAKSGRHHRGNGADTTLAPPPNLPRTPEAYATALIGDWLRHDRPDALRVATLKTVNHLFARRPIGGEKVTPHGCTPAGSVTNCTWTSVKRQIVLRVQNPTASTPLRVIGVTVTRL